MKTNQSQRSFLAGKIGLLLVSLLVGCGGGGLDLAGGGGGFSLAGVVVKGPVTGGTVTVYPVDATGTRGAPIGTAPTDASGAFRVLLSRTPAGPVSIEARGGSYKSEKDGTIITVTKPMYALLGGVTAATSGVAITPLSDMAHSYAIAHTTGASAVALSTAIDDADRAIAKLVGLPAGTTGFSRPSMTRPDFSTAALTGGTDGGKAALAIAALEGLATKVVSGVAGVSSRDDGYEAINKDFVDGQLNGKAGTVAITLGATSTVLPASVGLDLAAETRSVAPSVFTNANTGAPATANDIANASSSLTNGVIASVPTALKTTPSQGLIAVDTGRNVGYVPLYTFDGAGNAQFAVINLARSAANPVIKLISLVGSNRPVAASFNPENGMAYLEAATSGGAVKVYVVDGTQTANADMALNYPVVQTITMTGVTHSGMFGGIIANPLSKQVVVAGSYNMALLDISGVSAVQIPNTITSVSGTDSIALNMTNGILFNSSDGSRQIIDTVVNPTLSSLAIYSFGSPGFTNDGIAVDPATDTWVLSQEVGSEQSFVFNFAGLTAATANTAPYLTIATNTWTSPRGEGPGGQTAINVQTHQAVVADEFGHNFRVLQLPKTSYNGTPSTANAYHLASATLPKANINGTQTQLGIIGDPNTLSVDPVGNYAYMLADTNSNYHQWCVGCSTSPLMLVRVDLSSVPSTAGSAWVPQVDLITLP